METIDVVLLSFEAGAVLGYLFRKWEVQSDETLAYLRGESDTLERFLGPAVRRHLELHRELARNAEARRGGGA